MSEKKKRKKTPNITLHAENCNSAASITGESSLLAIIPGRNMSSQESTANCECKLIYTSNITGMCYKSLYNGTQVIFCF